MRRLIVSQEAISGDRIHITDKEDIDYISIVLRMKEGDSLLVSDGAGNAWETRIDRMSRGGIELFIISEQIVNDNESTRVTLYQGLPKGSKMEEIVRKATELGVFRIVPVGAARSIPGSEDISAAKLGRWRRIAKEASKQSRRLRVPEVSGVCSFAEAAAELADVGYDLILVLFELEDGRTLKHALRELGELKAGMPVNAGQKLEGGAKSLDIAAFVGPEGGFERAEVDRLVREGAESVSIGDTILRTETAGPAAIAMILYELDM